MKKEEQLYIYIFKKGKRGTKIKRSKESTVWTVFSRTEEFKVIFSILKLKQ